jgi:hypothetical protein
VVAFAVLKIDFSLREMLVLDRCRLL